MKIVIINQGLFGDYSLESRKIIYSKASNNDSNETVEITPLYLNDNNEDYIKGIINNINPTDIYIEYLMGNYDTVNEWIKYLKINTKSNIYIPDYNIEYNQSDGEGIIKFKSYKQI